MGAAYIGCGHAATQRCRAHQCDQHRSSRVIGLTGSDTVQRLPHTASRLGCHRAARPQQAWGAGHLQVVRAGRQDGVPVLRQLAAELADGPRRLGQPLMHDHAVQVALHLCTQFESCCEWTQDISVPLQTYIVMYRRTCGQQKCTCTSGAEGLAWFQISALQDLPPLRPTTASIPIVEMSTRCWVQEAHCERHPTRLGMLRLQVRVYLEERRAEACATCAVTAAGCRGSVHLVVWRGDRQCKVPVATCTSVSAYNKSRAAIAVFCQITSTSPHGELSCRIGMSCIQILLLSSQACTGFLLVTTCKELDCL